MANLGRAAAGDLVSDVGGAGSGGTDDGAGDEYLVVSRGEGLAAVEDVEGGVVDVAAGAVGDGVVEEAEGVAEYLEVTEGAGVVAGGELDGEDVDAVREAGDAEVAVVCDGGDAGLFFERDAEAQLGEGLLEMVVDLGGGEDGVGAIAERRLYLVAERRERRADGFASSTAGGGSGGRAGELPSVVMRVDCTG